MMIRFENANIFTADQRTAECFVVQDGRFAFVGSLSGANAAFPQAKAVDLGGRFVCPGFNDSHMHLLELGCTLTQAQLQNHTHSLSDVLNAIRDFAMLNPGEAWVLGRGFNHDDFTDICRYPTRDELDTVCPDRPCLITRACGHVAIANSRALALAGIDSAAPQINGGQVCTDENGRPNGALEENAISLVSSLIPPPDREGVKRRLVLAMEVVAAYGITSVQSDDFCALELPFEEIIAAYLELKSEGKLTVRVTEQCLLPTMEMLERFLSSGYHTGWGDELFRIGPLKLLTDGSLGARTAYLRAPYSDAPHTRGTAIYTQETLDAMVLRAHSAGMQIAAHAIGDAASEQVICAIEKAQAICPRADIRHGIVHAQVLDHDLAERMGKLGMHAYIQPIFLDYDTQIVHPRLGLRAESAYPAASLAALGVTHSAGSDCPVEPADVLRGIQCAVTRMSVTRKAQEPYLPQEALSPEDAISAFTTCGAYASFEESTKGKIKEGMLADFAVLGDDPRHADPQKIAQIPVLETYIAGRRIY